MNRDRFDRRNELLPGKPRAVVCPDRIPIAAARRIAEQHGCRQVIVLAFDAEGRTHVVTYGKTVEDCAQAAEGGNRMKRVMGWPEELCNAKPARVRRKEAARG